MTGTITRAHVCRFHEHVSLSLTDKHGDDLGTAAAVAKCAEMERERAYYKLVSEGWSDAEARGEVWPAAAEQGGA